MTEMQLLRVVVVCGNIGVGKSTLLREARRRGHEVYEEPVDEWKPLLEQVYKNKGGDELFRLQSLIYAHYCRLSEQLEAKGLLAAREARGVVIVERCPAEALRVFLPLNRDKFASKDYEALVHMHERLIELPVWTKAQYVVLRAPESVCMARIAGRARPGEQCIAAEYVHKLEQLLDDEFIPSLGDTVTFIDSSKYTPAEMLEQLNI